LIYPRDIIIFSLINCIHIPNPCQDNTMEVKKIGNIIVIYPYASLDIDMSLYLKNKIIEIISYEPDCDILLNLKNVDFINSLGIHLLMKTANILKKSNRRLMICDVTEGVTETFKIVNLMDLLKIFTSEIEAIPCMKV